MIKATSVGSESVLFVGEFVVGFIVITDPMRNGSCKYFTGDT